MRQDSYGVLADMGSGARAQSLRDKVPMAGARKWFRDYSPAIAYLKNGRHDWTRTSDLYRVKVAL